MKLQKFLNESEPIPLNESADTDFMETASCIGIICGKSFSDEIKTFLDSGKGDPKELLDNVKKLCGSGLYDWNRAGVKIIDSLDIENPKKVDVCFNLIVGMNEFMQDVGYKIVGPKPYFIHGSIKTYYKKEIEVFGKIPYTKDNTSDCVIISKDHKSLLKDMAGSEPDKDLKYMTTPSGIDFIQVSLKKSEALAQLGKVGTMVKGLYDIGSTKDTASLFAGTPRTDEGIWSKIMVFASHISSMVRGILNKITHMFGKVNPKHLSQFEKGMGINEAKSTSGKKFGTSSNRLIEGVISNPARATSLVNNEIKKLQEMVRSVSIPIKADTIGSFVVTDSSHVFKLVGNYLTIKTIQEMVSDTASLQKNVTKIVGEMYFGGTKLPMWKVFGYFKKKSYHYMGTLEGFLANKHLPSVDVMGVRMNKGSNAYTITLWMLEDVDESGKMYVQLRTGTNSSSKPTFIIEGTSKFGPVPLDQRLIEVM